MKRIYRLIWLFMIVTFINQDMFSQTCPNVQVTYPYGQWDGYLIIPGAAYYNDNTMPPQNKDSNNNLIVTWPNSGQGYLSALVFNGQDYVVQNFPLNIGSQPSFSSYPSILCNSQTGTFSITDVCGTLFSWVAPTGWSINGGGNTLVTSSKSVNITAPASGVGFNELVTVTSNTNYLGNISANVTLGTGTVDPLIIQKTVVCNGSQYSINAQVTTITGGTYQWYIGTSSGTNFVLKATSTSSSTIVSGGNVDNLYHTLKVVITNSCGSVNTANAEGRYKASCSGGGGFAIAYPNPAKTLITIKFSEPGDNESVNEVTPINFTATLQKDVGQILRSASSSNGIINIEVNDLPDGMYILTIFDGNSITKKQIFVKK